MRLNGNITKLSFIKVGVPSKICKDIVNRLPKLQSLSISQYFHQLGEQRVETHRNLSYLCEMRSLKELTYNSKAFAFNLLVDKLANAKSPLEHLGIVHWRVDLQLLQSLRTLDSLTKLGIIRCKLIEISLADVAKHLPKLTELHIENMDGMNIAEVKEMLPFAENLQVLSLRKNIINFKEDIRIDDERFQSILQMIKSRKNFTKLVINYAFYSKYVAVSKDLMQQNRHWLEIRKVLLPYDSSYF